MKKIRNLDGLQVIPRAEFEDRFGPLPGEFTGSTVTVDNRFDVTDDSSLLKIRICTGQPFGTASWAELKLEQSIRNQIQAGLAREGRYMELILRLGKKKFGLAFGLEGMPVDVLAEAECEWLETDGTPPPLGGDTLLESPPST